MTLGIDKTIASSGVQNIGVGNQVQTAGGNYKTNPIKPDSFKKNPVICTPYNQLDHLYQKVLETVAPSYLLDSYLDEGNVQKMIAQNPRVQEILSKYDVPLEINTNNVKDIKEVHINSTQGYAKGIAEQLNLSNEEKDMISKGALFHDYGKILIPSELLNKTERLTPEEKKIVDLHSALGYEMLKNTSLNEESLNIVKDHHKPFHKRPDYKTQIVSVADIYSALRTQRSYKAPLTVEQSMAILKKYSEMGQIDPILINALQKHVNEQNANLIVA